jgi:hypothetical protein
MNRRDALAPAPKAYLAGATDDEVVAIAVALRIHAERPSPDRSTDPSRATDPWEFVGRGEQLTGVAPPTPEEAPAAPWDALWRLDRTR